MQSFIHSGQISRYSGHRVKFSRWSTQLSEHVTVSLLKCSSWGQTWRSSYCISRNDVMRGFVHQSVSLIVHHLQPASSIKGTSFITASPAANERVGSCAPISQSCCKHEKQAFALLLAFHNTSAILLLVRWWSHGIRVLQCNQYSEGLQRHGYCHPNAHICKWQPRLPNVNGERLNKGFINRILQF